MSYIWWAIIAMGAYGAMTILLKLALRDIPPAVALVITNTILIFTGIGLVVYRGERITPHLNLDWPTLLIGMAGLALSVSIVSFYTALSRGPASVVAPIFAMNFAVAGFLGMILLGEGLTIPRVAGLILAAAAILLLTR